MVCKCQGSVCTNKTKSHCETLHVDASYFEIEQALKSVSEEETQSMFAWCLCVFGSGCTFGIRAPFKCYISLSSNIKTIFFRPSKNVSVAFHFTLLQTGKL